MQPQNIQGKNNDYGRCLAINILEAGPGENHEVKTK
jgi:hypothetical protein